MSELERLNKDCNLTAGLEVVLCIAMGARVMLRRNIDTKGGLVNGAIGTVTSIGANCVTSEFWSCTRTCQIGESQESIHCHEEFLCVQKAVSTHPCLCRDNPQISLSLDCAVMDLSDNVFSPGMAYVALSHVRTLAGVHLIAFSPASIMVSTKSLEEINRLRQLYHKNLPVYTLPNATGKGRK